MGLSLVDSYRYTTKSSTGRYIISNSKVVGLEGIRVATALNFMTERNTNPFFNQTKDLNVSIEVRVSKGH